ncbi:ATP-binding protein [Blastococcus deserti]|uniref:ATP-binding protein n=1 Tax=Blastococcus deserti TaxID=2259033 RepID=A0ABW4XCF4_9ACTN
MAGQEPFVGRETQLGALLAAVAAAEVGDGRVAFVGGEAGIGKTRLVTEVAARVAVPVLWARCWPGDGAPAFWPWQQLLRAVATGDGAADAGHSPTDHQEVARLLDEAETVGEAEGARFRLFDAVVAVLAVAAAPRPFVIVIDDLHWADEPSLRLLQFVGRDPRARRLTVIGTYRSTDLDAGHPLLRCFADLTDSGLHVSLSGLAKRDVSTLAAALTPGEALPTSAVSILHRRTGGNPLFVRELLCLLDGADSGDSLGGSSPASVPSSVRAVVAQRLARLSSRTGEMVSAGAVVGPEFDVGTVASLTEAPRDDVLAAMEEATSAGLVQPTGAGFGFVHALVQEVLYDGLPYPARAGLHRRMAAMLEREAHHRLPQLAHHLLQGAVDAEDRERAVDYAVRSGRHDLGLLAYERAAEWFSRALDALGDDADGARRTELFLGLGEASLAAGDVARARHAYREAAAGAQRDRDADQLARAALGLGSGLGGFEVQLLDVAQVELLEQALAALGEEPSVLRAWVLARLSVALSFMDSETRRRELSDAAVAMARQVDDPRALGYALAGHCDVVAGPDTCARRRDEAEAVIRLGLRAADPQLELLGRRLRLVALLELGEVGEADAEIERFARVADRLRRPLYRWYVPLWKGMRSLMRRELDEAARRRAEAEELGMQAVSGNATVLTFTSWWVQQRYEGRFAEAGNAMADVLGRVVGSGPPVTAGPRAIAALQQGDGEKARVLLRLWSSAPPRERSGDSEWLPESAQLAEAAVLAGARKEAETLYGQLRPYADLFCVEGIGAAVTGSVSWYLAMLARFLGHDAEARAYEVQARAAHQRVGLVGDPPALAPPQPARELAPSAAPAPASLVREGVTWAATYAGRTVRLRDSKGLGDIAVLLSRPDQDVHCLELMGAADVGAEPGPAIDQQARRAYERRILELQEEADDARADNDPARAERVEAELDALVQQLAEAFGLSSRGRATGSAVERARSAVGWRLRAAVRNAAELHPELGRHLKHAVRTGTWCSYRPEAPVRWEIRAGQGRRA